MLEIDQVDGGVLWAFFSFSSVEHIFTVLIQFSAYVLFLLLPPFVRRTCFRRRPDGLLLLNLFDYLPVILPFFAGAPWEGWHNNFSV